VAPSTPPAVKRSLQTNQVHTLYINNGRPACLINRRSREAEGTGLVLVAGTGRRRARSPRRVAVPAAICFTRRRGGHGACHRCCYWYYWVWGSQLLGSSPSSPNKILETFGDHHIRFPDSRDRPHRRLNPPSDHNASPAAAGSASAVPRRPPIPHARIAPPPQARSPR